MSLDYSMTVNLLTEQLLEFLRLKGGCVCSSESIHVKMPHCWKAHVTAQLSFMCIKRVVTVAVRSNVVVLLLLIQCLLLLPSCSSWCFVLALW